MKSDAETLTRALDWVNSRLQTEPAVDKAKVVDEAAFTYNLGPLDAEWLLNQVRQKQATSQEE